MSDQGHEAALAALDDVPYEPCPECQSLGQWIAPNTGNLVECPDCDGSGAVPPNNAALLAAYFAARGWPDPATLTLTRYETTTEDVNTGCVGRIEWWGSPFVEPS